MDRVFDLLYEGPISEETAFGYKFRGKWKKMSFKEYADKAAYLANKFVSLGITKGMKVASISYNRPEWNVLDMALLQIGAVHVSIFPNFNEEDFKYSLSYTDCEYVFVSSKLSYEQVVNMPLPLIKGVFTFDKVDGVPSIDELIQQGKMGFKQEFIDKLREKVVSSDLASIYLTSGTSGRSKGVVVTHSCITSTYKALSSVYQISNKDVAFSFAPLCVSSERSLNYYYQSNRIATYYSESMDRIIDGLQTVKPTIFLGAPMLLEKVRLGIYEKSKTFSGLQKWVFSWALGLAEKDYVSGNGAFNIQKYLADAFIFKRLRGILGGNVRFIMAGGASIPIKVLNFYWNIGIPVYEGYGLSECHIVSVNNDYSGVRFGTVGPLFKDVEVVIDNENQILCRSPYLFSGYYKMPELTNEHIDEFGFFKTGDCGYWVDNKFLVIKGRVKEIFKIQTGRYISPSVIEKHVNNSKYIEQSIVVGANKPYLVCIIVPAVEVLKEVIQEKLQTDGDGFLIETPELLELYRNEFLLINRNYLDSEKIVKFKIYMRGFSIDNGELTPSMKLKRSYLEEKFKDLINKMYED